MATGYKTTQRTGRKTAIITIATTPEIKNRLAALARDDDRTLSAFVEKILKRFING